MFQETPGTVGGSLRCKDRRLEAGGREDSWGVMRIWADNSSDDGRISLGYRLYMGHIVGEWKGPREESQITGFLL